VSEPKRHRQLTRTVRGGEVMTFTCGAHTVILQLRKVGHTNSKIYVLAPDEVDISVLRTAFEQAAPDIHVLTQSEIDEAWRNHAPDAPAAPAERELVASSNEDADIVVWANAQPL